MLFSSGLSSFCFLCISLMNQKVLYNVICLDINCISLLNSLFVKWSRHLHRIPYTSQDVSLTCFHSVRIYETLTSIWNVMFTLHTHIGMYYLNTCKCICHARLAHMVGLIANHVATCYHMNTK